MGCRNCSTTGTLLISQGSISIDMSKADVVPDVLEGEDDNRDLFSVITGGFFELKADNVAAHLDMFARPQVGAEFEIPLPEIPITPFTIPGVGMAGVSFAPVINLKYEVTGGVELNFGFDVAVPSNSRIHIDLTNLPASSVQGLPNTTITPLPLTANITDIDLTTSVAFRPTIPIGFKFLDTLNATVSVVLDLPRLDAKLTTRDNADENCNALNASVELPGPLKELGPLVLVETNVSLGVGIGMGLGFPKLPIGLNSLKTEINLFETSFPVATECVAPGKGWEAATKIWSGAAGAEVTPSGSVVVVETAPCSTTAVDVQPTPTPSQGYASFPPKNESGVVPPTGTGGFVPSATPTGPPIDQFTGLAGKMGLSMGWQVMLLGIGFVAGGMILL